MKRFGPGNSDMGEMDANSIYILRLKLQLIMANAYLMDYPMDGIRNKAVAENSRQVSKGSVDWGGKISNFRSENETTGLKFGHLFFERVKLLAVMSKSFAEGNPMGHVRFQALKDNVEYLSKVLVFTTELNDIKFLKVA